MTVLTKSLGMVALAAAALSSTAALAADKVILALPATSLTFSSYYIAQDAGFFKKEGLDVETRNIVGVGSVNALIGGSVQFTIGSSATMMRAVAKGQKLIAIANMIDKLGTEVVLRKDVAEAEGAKPHMSLAEAGKMLKGKTVAIQGVGSIVDATVRLVARKAGLDPDNDMTIQPLQPPSMLPALKAKQIDAYSTSLPWTTQAIVEDDGIMLASGPEGDFNEYAPFAYLVLEAKPDYCAAHADICSKMARAFQDAAHYIKSNPDGSLAILKKRFAQMDPKLLAAAWKTETAGHAENVAVTEEGLANAQQFNIDSGMLKESEKMTDLSVLFTDKYLK